MQRSECNNLGEGAITFSRLGKLTHSMAGCPAIEEGKLPPTGADHLGHSGDTTMTLSFQWRGESIRQIELIDQSSISSGDAPAAVIIAWGHCPCAFCSPLSTTVEDGRLGVFSGTKLPSASSTKGVFSLLASSLLHLWHKAGAFIHSQWKVAITERTVMSPLITITASRLGKECRPPSGAEFWTLQ